MEPSAAPLVIATFTVFSSRKPRLAVVPSGTAADGERALAEEALDYVDGLYGLARHLCPTASDAEDLVQETYARALAGAARFQAGGNLRAWLFRILRNCFIDQARRKKIALEIPDEHVAEREDVWDATALDRLRYLTRADIERALAALPIEHRFIVLLDVEGFSEAEIADIARIAPGTVKSRLSRARAKLRASLGEHRP